MKRRITAALAAVIVGLGIGAAPASAHWPDWQTSYNITANRASSYSYHSSGTVGDHSRYFNRIRYVSGGYCMRTQKIGHDYYVWDDYTLCYY